MKKIKKTKKAVKRLVAKKVKKTAKSKAKKAGKKEKIIQNKNRRVPVFVYGIMISCRILLTS